MNEKKLEELFIKIQKKEAELTQQDFSGKLSMEQIEENEKYLFLLRSAWLNL